jgi:hypothetical protein
MAKSVRYIYRGAQGRIPLNFNWPEMIKSAQAVVHITASEIKAGSRTTVGRVNQDFIYWRGDADVFVTCIAPHFNSHSGGEPGGVEFALHVNWNYPLDVAITITVEDETPVLIYN